VSTLHDEEAAEAAIETAPPARGGRWSRTQIHAIVLLTLLNVSNYLDRGVLGILQEPMKHDMGLKDWQLGMLSGLAFALFYSLAGVPAARIADRANRITVVSIALSIWSAMTMLCGVASSFTHLLLARLGVGAAEGSCTPTSHSLVSDLFPPKQRGLALSLITTSIPISKVLAPIVGGVIGAIYGWRAAFLAVGAPGLVLAVVIWMTMKDPRRSNPSGDTRAPGRFFADMRLLFANRAFLWLFIASAFLATGLISTDFFTASFFLRSFDLTLAQAGVVLAAGPGIAGLAATFVGGYLADRFAGKYGRSYPYVCAIGGGVAGILFLIAFQSHNWMLAIATLVAANFFLNLKNGPNFAAAQNFAPVHMRATASAVLMVAVIVVGAGVGPLATGWVSDIAAARLFPVEFGAFAPTCPGGRAIAGSAPAVAQACAHASAAGLRIGLLVPCAAFFFAAFAFWRSGRTIVEPLER
jgi:predicted MFS family arabinose efflux permease